MVVITADGSNNYREHYFVYAVIDASIGEELCSDTPIFKYVNDPHILNIPRMLRRS